MIKNLDLFSGIGGFSYALRSITKTIAYCEIDEQCRTNLKTLMDKNKLDRAFIFNDIKELRSIDLPQSPQMITAGWPCQDISKANPQGKGINGNKSKLFYEILRLIDEINTVEYVFLENSSNIISKGLKTVEKEFKKRNFKLKWIILNSADYGALHSRKRWYAIAFKTVLPNVLINKLDHLKKTFYEPLVIRRSLHHVKRCITLGNSVIPYIIQIAWNSLHEKEYHKVHRFFPIIFNFQGNVIELKRWSTPTHTGWVQHRKYYDRASRQLINQIMYSNLYEWDTSIPVNYRDRFYSINARFVEYLMGYPKDWTKI